MCDDSSSKKRKRVDDVGGKAKKSTDDIITPGEKKDFKELLLKVFDTHPNWKGVGVQGASVPIKTTRFRAAEDNRADVQDTGAANKCHTCLTDITTDRNQPFIGDHIPPRQIHACYASKDLDEIMPKDWDKGFVLLPHCDACAAEQSALVKRLCWKGSIADQYDLLTVKEKKLITGGRVGKIKGTSGNVTEDQGLQVQAEGLKRGCHSCAGGERKFPNKIYHADHFPPAELLTSYMGKLIKHLEMQDIKVDPTGLTIGMLLKKPVLRPQCARCSHQQGGLASKLRWMSMELARKAKIMVYKF